MEQKFQNLKPVKKISASEHFLLKSLDLPPCKHVHNRPSYDLFIASKRHLPESGRAELNNKSHHTSPYMRARWRLERDIERVSRAI